MKRKNLTRSEKISLTDFFVKGGHLKKLPKQFQGVPEEIISECSRRAEAAKKVPVKCR